LEGARDGVLATVGVTGEENRKALFVTRGVGFAEDFDNLGVGEPLWDGCSCAEAAAELWSCQPYN
jgi:hypothetical protein